MNSKKSQFFVVAVVLAALSFGPLTDIAIAQSGTTTSGPKPAPSFIKEAGKTLYDSAQKSVIRTMSEQIKQQQKTGGPGPIPGAAGALVNPYLKLPLSTTGAATVAAPARRTPPPMRSWMPQNLHPGEKPLLGILCVHGLGLQSNSYDYLGNELANKFGYAVFAIDVRGFGAWMNAGGKTHVNFDDCISDIKLSLESIRAAYPGMPIYLLGESMGGAIALRAASMYPDLVDGLISSVPAGERFNQGKTSIKVFLNLLTGFNVADIGGGVLKQATQNQALAAKWSGDPLARLKLTPQELIQFQDFMNNNHAAAAKVVDMPVLFLQGNGDQLVKPEGTWELFNAVASKDKSFFAVPGEHLIFEEAQTQEPGPRDQNFRVISSWLTAKVGRRARGGRRWTASAGAPGAGSIGVAGGGGYPGGGYAGAGYAGAGYRGGVSGGAIPYINTAGLEPQAQLIANGQATQAIGELEQISQLRPNDPNVLGLLGKAYLQNGQTDKAGYLFRLAMRKASRMGGQDAQAMNNFLLSQTQTAPPATGTPVTPSSTTAITSVNPSATAAITSVNPSATAAASPFAGWGGKLGQITAGLFGLPSLSGYGAATTGGGSVGAGGTVGAGGVAGALGGTYGGRGKCYAFVANWADQCKAVNDSLNQLSSAYGNTVDITRVNIEDPTSDSLVEQFRVGPIPTVVFVAPNGQVTSTIIGSSSTAIYEQALKGICR